MIVDITSAAELELIPSGAGVVAHRYARNATASSANTPIVAAVGSQVGVRDTGFRNGRVRLSPGPGLAVTGDRVFGRAISPPW